jgi:hypothetical protein
MITTALAALMTTTGTAEAHSYHHIDMLALKLQRQTRELHREVDIHFRHTRLYRHLHSDVEEMEHLAEHIHDVAHAHGSVAHLRADVEKLDRLYHHVEELVHDLAHDRRIDFRTIRHIEREMAAIGDTLHHLRDDLRHLAPVHRPHTTHIKTPGFSIQFGTRGVQDIRFTPAPGFRPGGFGR